MIHADVHMHCSFSNDSETPPESMIEASIKKGLSVICFTDHYDKDNFDWGDEAIFDKDAYFRQMPLLRDKYKDRIDLRIGAELGVQPYLSEHYQMLEKSFPFDFLIASAHVVNGHDLAADFLFKEYPDPEAYRIYYEEVLEDVKRIKSYDVFGHLDFVIRYSNHGASGHAYPDYMELIDEILRQIIADGKGIEINTSGIRYGLGYPHPHSCILKRYRELGGEIITVGADAHIPEHIGMDFKTAEEILTDCGFKYYTVFRQRIPQFVAF